MDEVEKKLVDGHILAIAAVILGASILQSAVGFAYGIVTIPFLVWFGIPLPEAMVITIVTAIFQMLSASFHLRASIPWQDTIFAIVTRLATFPLGLLILREITQMGQHRIRWLIAIMLTVVVVAQWALKVTPQEKLHWGWLVTAFGLSGFISGMVGMGGPPAVIWTMAHRWSTQRARGFLFASSVPTLPVQAALLIYAFDLHLKGLVKSCLILIPVLLVGTYVGVRLGNRISSERLRNIVYALLIGIALISILKS